MTDVPAEVPRPGRSRRIGRAFLVLIVGVLVLTGGYVGYVAIRHARPITLPAPNGAHAVGRVILDWTDQTRIDPFAARPASPRRLSVWVWYPAFAGSSGQAAPYAPGPWSQLHLPGIAGLAETSFDRVRTHSLDAAPVAAGRFPVVVWEPGLGFAASQYAAIAENLAGDGYLVVGVTPTYSANLTVLDHRVVRSNAAGNPTAFDGDDLHAGAAQRAGDRLVAVWSADARFAAAQAAGLNRSGPFAGHVDGTRIAYAGHSLGGAASLQACHDDPHCAAAVNLDGTQFGPVVHTGLRQPSLTMASEDSCVAGTCHAPGAGARSDLAAADSLHTASTGPAWSYQISGMRHFNFSDYDAYYLAAPLKRLLALGSLPRGRGLAITNAFVSAFLDHTVRKQAEPLLSDVPAQFPEVHSQGRS